MKGFKMIHYTTEFQTIHSTEQIHSPLSDSCSCYLGTAEMRNQTSVIIASSQVIWSLWSISRLFH